MPEIKRRNVTKDKDHKKGIINEKSDKLKPKKDETPNRNLSLKILSRSVVIFSLLIIVYFSSKDENIKVFAKQSEKLQGKGQVVECSASYMKEVDIYDGCFPKYCKRFVTDMVVSDVEADKLLAIAKKGLRHGGSTGGASILDLHSGAMSKGQYFVNFYKIPELNNVFDESDFNAYRVVKEKIKHSVAHHFGVSPDLLYLTHPTFFSEITSKEAVTVHDEYWHPHVDKETYKSFHYTTLLYLGDYGKDFEGGRFVFIDEKYNRTLEPRKGRVSMFTSGAENLHYVEKVTSGIRYAITVSFTCDQRYAIEDPSVNKYEIKHSE
ncbi:2-oxoglutarate and iron-dependent oxygenase domain-containing protein 3-like isoform X2 [Cydia strobilella]|uniref:2-oxoglutarate and iron-dependent oxygenase domain-containing protein 3-like isoform X2 n=1 Tax=Cydia strobilella TaxID=1100964 RepID=UPI003006EC58